MKTYGDTSTGISLATFDMGETYPGSHIAALMTIRSGDATMQLHSIGPSEASKLRRDLEAILAGLVESFWPEETEGYVPTVDEDPAEMAADRKADYDCWAQKSME